MFESPYKSLKLKSFLPFIPCFFVRDTIHVTTEKAFKFLQVYRPLMIALFSRCSSGGLRKRIRNSHLLELNLSVSSLTSNQSGGTSGSLQFSNIYRNGPNYGNSSNIYQSNRSEET